MLEVWKNIFGLNFKPIAAIKGVMKRMISLKIQIMSIKQENKLGEKKWANLRGIYWTKTTYITCMNQTSEVWGRRNV